MNFKLLKLSTLWTYLIILSVFVFGACANRLESANFSTGMQGYKDVIPDGHENTVAPSKRGIKISISLLKDDMKAGADGYYSNPDIQPMFLGGKHALENYVSSSFEDFFYPDLSEKTVKVQFGVNENGDIDQVYAVDDEPGYGMEEEAVKQVSRMPQWSPGKVEGRPVKTRQTLVINYQLESN